MSNILFVDDDYLTLEMYDKIFALLGHQILLAESGKIALQIANENSIDLIVVDMIMQDMDGFELLKQLKLNPILCETPIVMLSANPDLYAEQAIKAGANFYMTKPINPEKLLEILKSLGKL